MDSATATRSANTVYVVLLAVAFAGFSIAILAALGMVTSYVSIRSFSDEVSATGATRESAFAAAWNAQWPFLVVGLTLGILGTVAVLKRQRKSEHRTWRPILLGLVLSIPLSIAVSLLTMMLLAVWPVHFSESDEVRVQNDLGSTVTITLCPKQDCSGRRPQQLHDGDHLDYKTRNGTVPDSVVVQDRDGTTRCGILPLEDEISDPGFRIIGDIPFNLSDSVDADECGADVDRLDDEDPGG